MSSSFDWNYLESEVNDYLMRLFPLCRSLTGSANRHTLKILNEITPINIYEIPTGTKVYDWTVPKEWSIQDAYIESPLGKKIVDFKKNNLHVMSYSIPVNEYLTFDELRPNLYFHSDYTDAIPYRTSYYKEKWGFCLTKKQYDELERTEGRFKVVIDSKLENGSLTFGETLIKGQSKQEILISCYICHPSMANDSLSGVLLTTFLAKYLREMDTYWSYRVVYVPETLGAIAYCHMKEDFLKKINIGFVVTTVGGPGQFGIKKSWKDDHPINILTQKVLKATGKPYKVYPFDIHGSDERQYSSQGFRINCISITKDKYYEYIEYHTSKDSLDFVKSRYILETLDLYVKVIKELEKREIYYSKQQYCEVMLSKYGLYPESGGAFLPDNKIAEVDIILWLLFLCDGSYSLFDIANKLNADLSHVRKVAEKLERKKLIVRV